MTGIIFTYITCPDTETAKKIATLAIKKRLAACANIIPQMESLYWWDGKIDSAKEVVLILKTKKTAFSELRLLITKEHPYEVPCILTFDITNGNQPYLNWLTQEVP
jgi:periplasmic divalent cation tolerance protein